MESLPLRHLAARRGYICSSCIAKQGSKTVPTRRGFHASPLRRQGVLEKLEERGLINQIAGNRDTLSQLLSKERISIYAGVDPTAPSLHLGHLLPLMVLFWLHNHGHNVISLVGGATARVGDPSGRLKSRETVDMKVQKANARTMAKQTKSLWERAQVYGQKYGHTTMGQMQTLDNASWLDKLNTLDFLRVLGNGVRVGTMLGRDTVRNKMEKGDGMSFSEFTYPLLQGWDWWHMYKTHGVQVQVGGSDQYGNIVAGMDAVRHISQNEGHGVLEGSKRSTEPMGLTVPLLTTSSGEKFGKSAGNAIWLDSKMTSSFDLYGFLLKTADADVERYLKLFTFVPLDTLSQVMVEHNQDPGKRRAQHLLAGEVLELVHGPTKAQRTRIEHSALRNPTLDSLKSSAERKPTGRPPKANKTDDTAEPEDEQAPEREEEHGLNEQQIFLPESKVFKVPFPTILHNAGLAASKSEASRMISGGGVYVARKVEEEGSQELDFVPVKSLPNNVDVKGLLIEGQLVLRLGKWRVRFVQVVDEGVYDSPLLRV